MDHVFEELALVDADDGAVFVLFWGDLAELLGAWEGVRSPKSLGNGPSDQVILNSESEPTPSPYGRAHFLVVGRQLLDGVALVLGVFHQWKRRWPGVRVTA